MCVCVWGGGQPGTWFITSSAHKSSQVYCFILMLNFPKNMHSPNSLLDTHSSYIIYIILYRFSLSRDKAIDFSSLTDIMPIARLR